MSPFSVRRSTLSSYNRWAQLLCLSLLTQQACSQIVGCDVLSCDGRANNGCTLGNTTNSFIGTTNFTSGTSPNTAPYTWTVGTSSPDQNNLANSTDATFVKNFYLGTPPSVDLATETETAGCALFFEGIARSLPVNGNAEFGSVTCAQTLQDACISDLLAQATKQVQSIAGSGGNTQSVCSALQSKLQVSPPQSCLTVATVTWGSIVAKALTGPESISLITQSTCHPTSTLSDGSKYNIALVETQTVTSEEVSSDIAPFFYSITPILTVWYSRNGGTQAQTHAQLSCLKVVEDSQLMQANIVNGAGSRLGTTLWKAMMVAALVLSIFAVV